MDPERRVLVIAGLGARWDGGEKREGRAGKIKCHIWPIAEAADHVDFVSPGPNPPHEGNLTYWRVGSSNKYLTLLLQFLTAFKLVLTNDYDLIVSFSLFPYGVFTLICGFFSRTSTHLGIIGADLDNYAEGRLHWISRGLFRRFNIVTVGGSEYKNRLIDHGVDPEKIHIVLHPVDKTFSETDVSNDPQYDILWLTRMSEVKDPMFFLEVLDELERRGLEPEVAMVGDGPLLEEVRVEIDRRGMSDQIVLPGWSETPEEYYREAKIYVLTSQREMLPLTLVEAMLVGVVPVVPRLGAIPDIVEHGVNGYIIEQREVTSYADALAELLNDEERVGNMSQKATEIDDTVSQEVVAETWREIRDEVRQ